ncbi:MAG: zf-HC2 domain-containing protein, partial [Solirubrobacterales bacterium]|nr:zf-HC2 domain-containing protein [Solirubrobacterales bacterium]
MSTCPRRDDVGPWVLRALGEDEAAAFERHLESCEPCRHDVAELDGVAGVLPMAAPQLLPPPELKSRIMRVVEAEAELLRLSGLQFCPAA